MLAYSLVSTALSVAALQLRIATDHEVVGIDATEHAVTAYDFGRATINPLRMPNHVPQGKIDQDREREPAERRRTALSRDIESRELL